MNFLKYTLLIILFTQFNLNAAINSSLSEKLDSMINEIILDCINDTGYQTPHEIAYLAYALELRDNWKNEEAKVYFNNLVNYYYENKGFGLGYEWDAFGDKTINPANTNYTVTLTDHIGNVFIEACKNGLNYNGFVNDIVNQVIYLPNADGIEPGICYAYSDSEYDKCGCVHNVNAGVAYFFNKAVKNSICIECDTLIDIINQIEERELFAYNDTIKNWLYWDGRNKICDHNHLAYQIECLLHLNERSKDIALEAGLNMLKNRELNNWYSYIGYLRILPYFPDNADFILNEFSELLFDMHKELENRTLIQYAVWYLRYKNIINE